MLLNLNIADLIAMSDDELRLLINLALQKKEYNLANEVYWYQRHCGNIRELFGK